MTMDRPEIRDILLVEDNSGDAELAAEALSEGNRRHRLHQVRDGEEALAFLRRKPPFEAAPTPHLLLVDLNLPRRDGRELLTEIKNDPDLRRIPVVVLTTSEADRDVAAAYDLHANCYITKPIELQRFIEVLQAIESFWFTVVKLPPMPCPMATTKSQAIAAMKRILQVLFIEDNPGDVELIEALLDDLDTRHVELTVANTLNRGCALLEDNAFDVVLLDLSLPDASGLEPLRRLRAVRDRVPVVIFTGLADDTVGLQAMQEGAQDYLIKGQVDGQLLVRTVRYAVERQRLVCALTEANENIRTLRGLLPICSICKKIRDDRGYWTAVERYIGKHSGACFSHGYCPDCYEQAMREVGEWDTSATEDTT